MLIIIINVIIIITEVEKVLFWMHLQIGFSNQNVLKNFDQQSYSK